MGTYWWLTPKSPLPRTDRELGVILLVKPAEQVGVGVEEREDALLLVGVYDIVPGERRGGHRRHHRRGDVFPADARREKHPHKDEGDDQRGAVVPLEVDDQDGDGPVHADRQQVDRAVDLVVELVDVIGERED